MQFMDFPRLALVLGLALTLAPTITRAQDTARPPEATKDTSATAPGQRRATVANAADAPAPQRKLPADSVTRHTVELPGRKLSFKATAGALPVTSDDGTLQGEIAYIAYELDGAEQAKRPVTFAFNGGPGSASAWLHVGTLGPWRLPMSGAAISPSAPPVLVPNAETWLDFTDLVLIDPAGTGYSRVERPARPAAGSAGSEAGGGGGGEAGGLSGGQRSPLWSVDGDIRSLSEFIGKWVAKANRHMSPKVMAGESYGGFRLPKLAYQLQSQAGIGVGTLIIISPVLDFGLLRGRRDLPMTNVMYLPSLAAAALEAQGKAPDPAQMKAIESYAKGDFLADLMRGPGDAASVDRIVKKVAELTALPEATIRQYGGRLDGFLYRREASRAKGEVASPYDASVKGADPDPTALLSRSDDPFSTGLQAPVTTAMIDLFQQRLKWTVDAKYYMLNRTANSAWQWGNSTTPPEAMTQLRQALALDPRLAVMVAHGYTDTVTPYFGSTLLLDQLPSPTARQRVQQVTYPGGHMFYARDASRARFRDDVRRLVERAGAGDAGK